MPFIPHTAADTAEMLAALGLPDLNALFEEIPAELRCRDLPGVPAGLGEMAVARLMSQRAAQDRPALCFCGAGAYEHHIPAAVWQIATRGEFYSSYTPYQAEASQGTLQVLYEFQTMMAELMAMDVSNASLYDGASALAEAVLMAVRCHHGSKRVLLPRTLHPAYRRVVRNIVHHQGIELLELPYDPASGVTALESLAAYQGQDIAALVIPQPNFFGALEDVDALSDWAAANGALAIAQVNPTAMAWLKPPGAWGARGVDIACGEGQPLGAPLCSGGPYFGFLCCRMAHVRQMPGRVVGATVDREGQRGYVLTLQAREQHIRRSKATSNICTNQGLMATAATIYLSLLGAEGLARVAAACHANTLQLLERLTNLPGVERVFSAPLFHEAVVRLPLAASDVLRALARQGIVGGYALGEDYPELGAGALLVCATETKTGEDIDAYAAALAALLSG